MNPTQSSQEAAEEIVMRLVQCARPTVHEGEVYEFQYQAILSLLDSHLRQLASEVLERVPEEKLDYPDALPFPHPDDDVKHGWNRARSALKEYLKDRGLVE